MKAKASANTLAMLAYIAPRCPDISAVSAAGRGTVGPGLGLVTIEPRPGHGHPNSRQVLLTAKGRSLAKEIFKQMRRAGSGNH